MARESIILMDDTTGQKSLVGPKRKADGWYGKTDGQHTVAFYLNAFEGRLRIEATLETDPGDDDWFNVVLDGESLDYLDFTVTTTNVVVRTFKGNFVWVRAVLDRNHLPGTENDYGNVRKILMNH